MEELGWLKGKSVSLGGKRTRRDYRLTNLGEQVLELMRGKIRGLYDEVVYRDRKGGKL